MKYKCILFVLTTACAASFAQTFDIRGYCGEMSRRQGLDFAWREKCIAALEVQQKYLEKYQREQQTRSRTEQFIAKGEWMTELLKLQKQEKEAQAEEAPIVAARVDQHMTQCRRVWGNAAECEEFAREINAGRRK